MGDAGLDLLQDFRALQLQRPARCRILAPKASKQLHDAIMASPIEVGDVFSENAFGRSPVQSGLQHRVSTAQGRKVKP